MTLQHEESAKVFRDLGVDRMKLDLTIERGKEKMNKMGLDEDPFRVLLRIGGPPKP